MQEGVFRVNCIDCLDRTNVTMTNLSLVFIDQLLKRIRNAQKQKYNTQDDQETDKQVEIEINDLFELNDLIKISLKDFWVKTGDVLSLQYTGTESNISRVTKDNKKGLIGKLEQWHVGVSRYYQYLLHDDFKHECILSLQGKHPFLHHPAYGIQEKLNIQLDFQQGMYCEIKEISLKVLSKNMNGILIQLDNQAFIDQMMDELLGTLDDYSKADSMLPEIYVFGL